MKILSWNMKSYNFVFKYLNYNEPTAKPLAISELKLAVDYLVAASFTATIAGLLRIGGVDLRLVATTPAPPANG